MNTVKRRIALVARADSARKELGDYLRSAGFDVHECTELEVVAAFAALVVMSGADEQTDLLVQNVRSWMKSSRSQRVLVVTPRPTALKDLLAVHPERLQILPAPAFGWDVVDALRAGQPARPRGA